VHLLIFVVSASEAEAKIQTSGVRNCEMKEEKNNRAIQEENGDEDYTWKVTRPSQKVIGARPFAVPRQSGGMQQTERRIARYFVWFDFFSIMHCLRNGTDKRGATICCECLGSSVCKLCNKSFVADDEKRVSACQSGGCACVRACVNEGAAEQ